MSATGPSVSNPQSYAYRFNLIHESVLSQPNGIVTNLNEKIDKDLEIMVMMNEKLIQFKGTEKIVEEIQKQINEINKCKAAIALLRNSRSQQNINHYLALINQLRTLTDQQDRLAEAFQSFPPLRESYEAQKKSAEIFQGYSDKLVSMLEKQFLEKPSTHMGVEHALSVRLAIAHAIGESPELINKLEYILEKYLEYKPGTKDYAGAVKHVISLINDTQDKRLAGVLNELNQIDRKGFLSRKRERADRRIKGLGLVGEVAALPTEMFVNFNPSDLDTLRKENIQSNGGQVILHVDQARLTEMGSAGGCCFGFSQRWGENFNFFRSQGYSMERIIEQFRIQNLEINATVYTYQKNQKAFSDANMLKNQVSREAFSEELRKQLFDNEDLSINIGALKNTETSSGHSMSVARDKNGIWFYDSNGYIVVFPANPNIDTAYNNFSKFMDKHLDMMYGSYKGGFFFVKTGDKKKPWISDDSLMGLTAGLNMASPDKSSIKGIYQEANLFILSTMEQRIQTLEERQTEDFSDSRVNRILALKAIYQTGLSMAKNGQLIDIHEIEQNIRKRLAVKNEPDLLRFEEGVRKITSGYGASLRINKDSEYAKMLQEIESNKSVIEAKAKAKPLSATVKKQETFLGSYRQKVTEDRETEHLQKAIKDKNIKIYNRLLERKQGITDEMVLTPGHKERLFAINQILQYIDSNSNYKEGKEKIDLDNIEKTIFVSFRGDESAIKKFNVGTGVGSTVIGKKSEASIYQLMKMNIKNFSDRGVDLLNDEQIIKLREQERAHKGPLKPKNTG